MLLPLTNFQQLVRFGEFEYRRTDSDRIIQDPAWVRRNIRSTPVPGMNRTAYLHELAIQAFEELWADWQAQDLTRHIKTWNGSWNPRLKRGKSALSRHSWGTAFDVNAALYPLGRSVPVGSPMYDLAAVAERHGWFWGGRFRTRPDGMHFEYAE